MKRGIKLIVYLGVIVALGILFQNCGNQGQNSKQASVTPSWSQIETELQPIPTPTPNPSGAICQAVHNKGTGVTTGDFTVTAAESLNVVNTINSNLANKFIYATGLNNGASFSPVRTGQTNAAGTLTWNPCGSTGCPPGTYIRIFRILASDNANAALLCETNALVITVQ